MGRPYCVFGVYTNQQVVFDRGERRLLAELGEIVGYGLHTIASMEDLRSEQVVELLFESWEPCPRSSTTG